MKAINILIISLFLLSCNSGGNKEKSESPQTIKKEITGVWELLRMQYYPDKEPTLVGPLLKEYIEIKADGTCTDDGYPANWYISNSDDYIVDSMSKTLFIAVFFINRKQVDVFNRKIEAQQIKLVTEGKNQYLYLRDIQTSVTRIFIRKT